MPDVEHWGHCPLCERPVLDKQRRWKVTEGVYAHADCWLQTVAVARARLAFPGRRNGRPGEKPSGR